MRRARARWTAAAISNYTIEQRRLCFCPPGWDEWARVTVRNGLVVSAVRVDDGAPIGAGGRITVDAMFDILEQAPDIDHLGDVQVDFDSQYGYPTLIEIIHKPEVTDGGLTLQARALVVGQ